MDELLAMKYGEDELDDKHGEVPHREICSSPIQSLELNYKFAPSNVNESLFMMGFPRIPYAYVVRNPTTKELCTPIYNHLREMQAWRMDSKTIS